MTRIAATLLAALAATPAAVAWSRSDAAAKRVGTDDAATRQVALVRLEECSRGPEALDRHATFRATMRRVPDTRRMSMRFTLQERVGNGRFQTVKAPGLDTWRKSHPAVRRFSHRQRVLELAEGSVYRVVVSFRWHRADGRVIRRARRRSKACDQPGLLSNPGLLRVGAGVPSAGASQPAAYTVRVINRARTSAPRFSVTLAVDEVGVGSQGVAGLAPGEVRDVVFAGPPCEASVTARVDPEDAVREASEKDNVLTAPCPPRR